MSPPKKSIKNALYFNQAEGLATFLRGFNSKSLSLNNLNQTKQTKCSK